MNRLSLLQFIPLGRFDWISPLPDGSVRKRLAECLTDPRSLRKLVGTVGPTGFELHLQPFLANSGRAFLVGRVEPRIEGSRVVGYVCISSAPAFLVVLLVSLGLAIQNPVVFLAALAAVILVCIGHVKSRRHTIAALRHVTGL